MVALFDALAVIFVVLLLVLLVLGIISALFLIIGWLAFIGGLVVAGVALACGADWLIRKIDRLVRNRWWSKM